MKMQSLRDLELTRNLEPETRNQFFYESWFKINWMRSSTVPQGTSMSS